MSEFVRTYASDKEGFTQVTKKDKKRRYQITDDEQSLVLKAYEELNGDWGKMVEYMKDNVMRTPGNYMKKFKTNEYYQGASEEAAKKRLRRIVTENVKKVATGTPLDPPVSQVTSSSTVTLSSTSTLSGTATHTSTSPSTAMASVIRDRRERYSKKISPEERRASAKFSYANDESTTDSGDEEVLVEVKDKPVEVKDKPNNKRKKKGSTKEKAAKKTQQKHTEMCDKAILMIDRIGRFLDKYETETSESE